MGGVEWGWNQATLVRGMEKAEMQGSGKRGRDTARGWSRAAEGKGLGLDEDRQALGVGKEEVLTEFCEEKWRGRVERN